MSDDLELSQLSDEMQDAILAEWAEELRSEMWDVTHHYDLISREQLENPETLFDENPRKAYYDKTLRETRPDGIYVHDDREQPGVINDPWLWWYHKNWEDWHKPNSYRQKAREIFEIYEPKQMVIPIEPYRKIFASGGIEFEDWYVEESWIMSYEVEEKDNRMESVCIVFKGDYPYSSPIRVRFPGWNYHHNKQFSAEAMLAMYETWMVFHQSDLMVDRLKAIVLEHTARERIMEESEHL